MVRRVSTGALVVLWIVGTASGCTRAPLRVGTTGDYPPFSVWNAQSGELTGVDIDLARAYAGWQGREVIFVRTSWSTLMQDLTAGAFDIALSGITVTPERERAADFSVPYYRGFKTPVVRCSDKNTWKSLEAFDRPHIRAMYNPGGANEVFAKANLPNADLEVESDSLTIVNRIAAGEADVFFTDSFEAIFYTYHRHDVCIGLYGTDLAPFDIAAMGPHDSPEIERVDTWLRLPASTHLTTEALKFHIAAN